MARDFVNLGASYFILYVGVMSSFVSPIDIPDWLLRCIGAISIAKQIFTSRFRESGGTGPNQFYLHPLAIQFASLAIR